MQTCAISQNVAAKNMVAIKLLTFLAGGGTVERLIAELPLSKTQIESAFDWLRTGGRCTAAEVVARANRLREIVMQKHDAIERNDFDLAACKRDQERAIYESFWLKAPTGEGRILASMEVAEQVKILREMFREGERATLPAGTEFFAQTPG